MSLFGSKVKRLIEQKDYDGLRHLLTANPGLSNKGITIPFDPICMTKAHPLHRLCDAVFANKLSEDEAIRFAKIFLENGARIDGDKVKNEGTPLLAAASLHAEQLGIYYIERGADIHYTYQNDGATALHWAAYCGLEKLVERLIQANAAIDNPDAEHLSTPLGWALHALMTEDKSNANHQITCINLLLQAGADPAKLKKETFDFLMSLDKDLY